MNFAMWRKALQVIPDVSKPEWDALDVISKWLISTRAAVLVLLLGATGCGGGGEQGKAATDGDTVRLPPVLFQPMAADDVATLVPEAVC